MKGENTHTGGPNTWRDASDGGWFSYTLRVDPVQPMELVLTYSSTDGGNREFEIFAEHEKIGEQNYGWKLLVHGLIKCILFLLI